MAEFLLGIDLGTTNVKAILFSADGRIQGRGEANYITYHDYPDYAEHDPQECWEATAAAIRNAVKPLQTDDNIRGICVSSNAPTLIPMDAEGKLLGRGMIWMDRRATKESQQLVDIFGGADGYEAHFGGKADPFYLNAKLLWFKNHEPELYAKTRHVLLTNGYINYKLTGEYSIDTVQAKVVSHLYDTENQCWDRKIADFLKIDLEQILPAPKDPCQIIGTVTREASNLTGVKAGTPVVCGTADGGAAPLETGIVRQGDAADVTGTSTLLFYAFDKPAAPANPLMHVTQPFDLPNAPYLLQGSVNTSGASLKWYANLFKDSVCKATGLEQNVYCAIDQLAEQAAPGCNGLLYFPYLAGERAPLWSSELRGMFIGLTTKTNHAELVRAILEGTAFAMRETTDYARSAGCRVERFFASGGGAKSDIWTQIKASMLNLPISVSLESGGAPQGDALIAGYGVGLYKNFEEAVKQFKKIDKIIEPVAQWSKLYDEMYDSFLEIRQTLLQPQKKLNSVIQEHARYYQS